MTPQRPYVVCNWAGTTTPCEHPHCECPDALVAPLYTSQPSENGTDWYVWNMREALPPKPVFTGSMEDAGLVADALNKREGVDYGN